MANQNNKTEKNFVQWKPNVGKLLINNVDIEYINPTTGIPTIHPIYRSNYDDIGVLITEKTDDKVILNKQVANMSAFTSHRFYKKI